MTNQSFANAVPNGMYNLVITSQEGTESRQRINVMNVLGGFMLHTLPPSQEWLTDIDYDDIREVVVSANPFPYKEPLPTLKLVLKDSEL